MAQGNSKKQSNGSGLDFESQLWAAADKMRGHMDASECTPQCVVHVLVAMLEPYKGRVFETLQSVNMNCSNRRMKRGFSLSASNGERAGVRCRNFKMNQCGVQNFRRQSWPGANTTIWKLARMNLAIRGIDAIDANLGSHNANNFRQNLHPDLKADLVPVRKDLTNPPFNMSDWGDENLQKTFAVRMSSYTRKIQQ